MVITLFKLILNRKRLILERFSVYQSNNDELLKFRYLIVLLADGNLSATRNPNMDKLKFVNLTTNRNIGEIVSREFSELSLPNQ